MIIPIIVTGTLCSISVTLSSLFQINTYSLCKISEFKDQSEYNELFTKVAKRIDRICLTDIFSTVCMISFMIIIVIKESTNWMNQIVFVLALLLFIGISVLSNERIYFEVNKSLNNGLTKRVRRKFILSYLARAFNLSLVVYNIMNYFVK